ncbi:MAG: 4-(cytidine 5'-diphospho)-2-C-methyl-D-erythritol kinase [Lentisphaerae bacterium GWF2_52_8]|nr:MAG: 4-(cytidine 5'-diphospho)-2-C-methyl-D-erythritol kinase [Lentisphaerae bacterium GWF2_52_8]
MSLYCTVAPGKVNLLLSVTRKREDGYHDLETIFYPIRTPTDSLSLTMLEHDGLELSCTDPSLSCDSKNLCWRAAELYAESAGITPRWHIHLEKNIPIAAGLGGGSSNAAAVLRLLQDACASLLSQEKLQEIALRLGADVTFFLSPRPSLARGVGEVLYPINDALGDLPLTIAAPCFPVSAAWAYQNLKRIAPASEERRVAMLQALRLGDWVACGNMLYNDLSPALYEKFPLLKMIRECMFSAGASGAEISGSGPTLFAVSKDNRTAAAVAAAVKSAFGDAVKVF